jgi:hypothetical protein
MAMRFEELDDITRRYMLSEFEDEQSSGNPYRSKALSQKGLEVFPDLVREAMKSGDEQTLTRAISDRNYWKPTETYERNGIIRSRNVNIRQASERLGLTEFNTWYVRGLAKRLMVEGVSKCQVYRGAIPKWEPAECSVHEGKIYEVKEIYDGHRVRYWPEPGKPQLMSIPYGPGCHHTIRRVNE